MLDGIRYVAGELRFLVSRRHKVVNTEHTLTDLFEKCYFLVDNEEGINYKVFNDMFTNLYNIKGKFDNYENTMELNADLNKMSFAFSNLEPSENHRKEIREFRYMFRDLTSHLQTGGKLR